MELLNTYRLANKSAGFTLIEILISLGILSIILSLGLLISFDSYRGYLFRSEGTVLVSVLEKARSRSMSNYYGSEHGVCYNNISKNYVLFRGSSYPGVTGEIIGSNPSVVISSTPVNFLCSSGGVVFRRLTGDLVGVPIEIYMLQNNKTSTTSINYEGTINW